MQLLPADIEPYITSAITECRRKITLYENLQTKLDAAPEELDAWIALQTVYQTTLETLLGILGS